MARGPIGGWWLARLTFALCLLPFALCPLLLGPCPLPSAFLLLPFGSRAPKGILPKTLLGSAAAEIIIVIMIADLATVYATSVAILLFLIIILLILVSKRLHWECVQRLSLCHLM